MYLNFKPRHQQCAYILLSPLKKPVLPGRDVDEDNFLRKKNANDFFAYIMVVSGVIIQLCI